MKKLYGDHYKSYQVIDGWNKGNISDLYNNIWPEAVNNFLALNKENIVDKKCDVVDMQYYIALCRLWKDISNCING